MPLMWLSLAFLAGVVLASVIPLATWTWLLFGAGVLGLTVLGARLARSSRPALARLGASLSVRFPFADLPFFIILGICFFGATRLCGRPTTLQPG